MNKSIVFFILLFFLSTGFVEYNKPVMEDGGKQREFLEFLSYFEKVSLPYSVGLNTFEKRSYSKSAITNRNKLIRTKPGFNQLADTFISASRFGKFSRMGRPILEPMARFYVDDQTVAIVYSSRLQYGSGTIADYYIAYYDLSGNLLGRTNKKRNRLNDVRIGFTNLHHCQTFTIFPSQKIKTVFYDNQWKEKAGSVAQTKNELLGFRKSKTVDYEFSKSKGVQEIAQVAAVRP